jgi:HPt (histidine-containing phosphotransfer) domain-containing protein
MAATFDKDGAMDRVDGDVELLKSLIDICKVQCKSRLGAMENLLRNESIGGIASHAHAIKGSLGNVGAESASAVAARLEAAAKEEDEGEVSSLLASLQVEVDEFFEVADEELS